MSASLWRCVECGKVARWSKKLGWRWFDGPWMEGQVTDGVVCSEVCEETLFVRWSGRDYTEPPHGLAMVSTTSA